MFDIALRPLFTVPVIVRALPGTGGADQDFTATFEALEIDEFNSFDLSTPAGVRTFLERAIVNLDDIANGPHFLAYDTELRDKLINNARVRAPLVNAYLKGLGEAAQGN